MEKINLNDNIHDILWDYMKKKYCEEWDVKDECTHGGKRRNFTRNGEHINDYYFILFVKGFESAIEGIRKGELSAPNFSNGQLIIDIVKEVEEAGA